MKVLFISSGNASTFNGISPIVYAQGESLRKQGMEVIYYGIKGKGIKAYLKSIPKIKSTIKETRPEIIHAHYSLSGIASSLAGAKPIVVSLMGSDVKEKWYFKFILWLFYKFIWHKTIVKSEDMKASLKFKAVEVIPNGVSLETFRPESKTLAREKLKWEINKKYILFASNPDRPEKNFQLFKASYDRISNKNVLYKALKSIEHKDISWFMNAADAVALSSLWEGSPNVIKEAMACNRPIVTTNVGDVQWLLKDCEGTFISDSNVNDYSLALSKAVETRVSTGRQKLKELDLSEECIANKLIDTYKRIIQ